MHRGRAALVPTVVLILAGMAPVGAEPARIVVMAGQAAPGGGIFEHFGVERLPVVAAVNSRGQVAFFSTLLRAPGNEGVFLASPSQIVKVAIAGDPVPGGGTISGFSPHPVPALNEAGAVAFVASVAGGRTVEGIFVVANGRSRAVALTGNPAPGLTTGTFAALDMPTLNDRGDIAFLATIRRGRETVEAIYARAGGTLRKVVAQGDPAPAGGTFVGFGPPVLNNRGTAAFAAVVEGPGVPGGVFVAEGPRIRMLAGAGEETPLGGIFAKLSERVALNDNGTVAFTAVLRDAPVESAIFVSVEGRLRKVVALGDAAPGGGIFSHFGLWPALGSSGVVAFTASVDGGTAPLGVFVARDVGIERVSGVGDALPSGSVLASFGLYPIVSMSPRGGVAFASARTATGEGTEAIFYVPGRAAR